jgi:hypothetical protein
MTIHRLQQLSTTSGGIALPKRELADADLLADDGTVIDGQQMLIQYHGDGEWSVKTC